MNQHVRRRFTFVLILMLSAVAFAQQPSPASETQKDTITRIFAGEFSERPFPPPCVPASG